MPITEDEINELVDYTLGKEEESAKTKTCPICLDALITEEDTPTFTPCFHGFHSKCINTYIRYKIKERIIPCPMCKCNIAALAGYRDPATLYEPDAPLANILLPLMRIFSNISSINNTQPQAQEQQPQAQEQQINMELRSIEDIPINNLINQNVEDNDLQNIQIHTRIFTFNNDTEEFTEFNDEEQPPDGVSVSPDILQQWANLRLRLNEITNRMRNTHN